VFDGVLLLEGEVLVGLGVDCGLETVVVGLETIISFGFLLM
jgi:hypothetical protein